jgi:hypothetical protein
MARQKTLRESVRGNLALSERLSALRIELFGDRGGPEIARRLGIPIRTWYNYEGGGTVPLEIVLKVIELTSVEAGWLLQGEGPKFRTPPSTSHAPLETPHTPVAEILSRVSSLAEPAEFEELTACLLAVRAKRLAPVATGEETRLLLAINEGVAVEFSDRAAS